LHIISFEKYQQIPCRPASSLFQDLAHT